MSDPIVFLDTETTGVHPGRKVWEVGMIRREPSGREREISLMVDVDLSKADPFGLRVGRFYDRHPYGQYLAGLRGKPDASTPGNRPAATTLKQGDMVVAITKNNESIARFVMSAGTEGFGPRGGHGPWGGPPWGAH